MVETPHTYDAIIEQQYRNQQIEISKAVRWMSKHTLWESKCLVQAIAAMKMLERRKIESTLYLGTGKDDNGKMIAHAWLRSGSRIITGAEMMKRFTVVAIFGKEIQGERYIGKKVRELS